MINISSNLMKTLSNSKQSFYCDKCNYKCFSKYNFKRHLKTNKHQINSEKKCNIQIKKLICANCSLTFTSRTSLWRHSKQCMYKNKRDTITQQLLKMITKQQEDTNKIIETMTKITKFKQVNYNMTNNISINMFLNNECRDAISLTDFVDNVKLTLDDLNYTNKHGYIKGISNIFVKNLTEIKPKYRPIYCSDNKRQIYIKESDHWTEDKNYKKMDKSIDNITIKQIKYIKEWILQNPEYETNEIKRNEYFSLIRKLMGGATEQEQQSNKTKIIKNMSEDIIVKEALNNIY